MNMARSDESEPEDRDTVERDALLLAQTYTSQETKVGISSFFLLSVESCVIPKGYGSSLFLCLMYDFQVLIGVVCSNLFTNANPDFHLIACFFDMFRAAPK